MEIADSLNSVHPNEIRITPEIIKKGGNNLLKAEEVIFFIFSLSRHTLFEKVIFLFFSDFFHRDDFR
jgi:hypothetical protein